MPNIKATVSNLIRNALYGRNWNPSPPVHGGPAGQSGSSDPGTEPASAPTTRPSNLPRINTIPFAGFRTGEIIGYRGWLVGEDGLLRSVLCTQYIWEPGAIMTGDVREEYGVHAYKEPHMTMEYCLTRAMLVTAFPSQSTEGEVYRPIYAVGRVALWGEVIEHEDGWRAECGRILELKGLLSTQSRDKTIGIFEALKEKYKV